MAKEKRMKIKNQEHLDVKKKKQQQPKRFLLEEIKKKGSLLQDTSLKTCTNLPRKVKKKVSLPVAALPPTQISLLVLFSAIRFVKSDLRFSLKEDFAEAILFFRNY
ncbi:hypothetical protein TNCV_704321 [Trichonephila clavipes]|nr:hypothetical protein TNCV_704321 [Trichonephila clavipes]